MININFQLKGYVINSVEENGLDKLNKWMKINNSEDKTCYSLDNQMFYRRYLEYYITEDECFLEVYKDEELVGVFKGRLEGENKKELLIWLFIIKKELRNSGLGSEILQVIIEYFKEEFTIDTVQVGVNENNIEGISFWDSNEFKVSRIIYDFFQDEVDKGRNLVIMGR